MHRWRTRHFGIWAKYCSIVNVLDFNSIVAFEKRFYAMLSIMKLLDLGRVSDLFGRILLRKSTTYVFRVLTLYPKINKVYIITHISQIYVKNLINISEKR